MVTVPRSWLCASISNLLCFQNGAGRNGPAFFMEVASHREKVFLGKGYRSSNREGLRKVGDQGRKVRSSL